MTLDVPGVRRVTLVVDVEAYTVRDNRAQVELQQTLLWTLERACTRAGVGVGRCLRQDRGDGQLLILPAGIDESRQLPLLLRGARAALHRANQAPGIAGRMRLRAALSQGIVHRAATGFVGRSVVLACRLLDSAVLHEALDDHEDTDLAVIVSDDLYSDVFAHGYGDTTADDFRRVDVTMPAKRFAAPAWVHVPGPASGVVLREAERLPPPGRGPRSGPVLAAFGGAVAGAGLVEAAITALNWPADEADEPPAPHHHHDDPFDDVFPDYSDWDDPAY
ncbi:hypothetical protein ACFFX1_04360 [Dactylosporangium sucinum]|uniref:Guanylate cyclase domain-containing protein n=1 Tax=Dactylosporangium sucinum TaxID=1424081 RepID=A0A917T8S4_9ACTN|nr:hypothetical protein [Dactylosporangium sucinum]GGM14685.1 hypothetical protein GCM10007977_014720 [Dactylosporangium sucinum]